MVPLIVNLDIDVGGWSSSCTGFYIFEEKTSGTSKTRGWEGFRGSMDVSENVKRSSPAGNQPCLSVACPVV